MHVIGLLYIKSFLELYFGHQGHSQEFATGDKGGSLGTEVPQVGPGAETQWGSAAKPQKPKTRAEYSTEQNT